MRRRDVLTALAASALANGATARTRAPARCDLTGLWTNATYTPLQRRRNSPPHLVLTEAEADAFEAPLRATHGAGQIPGDTVGQAETEFPEMGAGLLRIRGEIRSSIITDPPDGRVPYSRAGRKRLGFDDDAPDKYDNPEDLSATERCLGMPSSGAPIIPSQDANVLSIVQTPTAVAIVTEKLHELRVIRLDAAMPPHPVPSWTGVSVGRWEGATLVVETAGLRPGLTDRFWFWLSDQSRVTERFTRTSQREIAYSFTVDDPGLLDRPWSGELLLTPAPAMFEYACHEGNYSLGNILSGARQDVGGR